MKLTKKKYADFLVLAVYFIALFILITLFTPDLTTAGKFDRRCWINWANFIYGNGLEHIYKLDVDYLPLYHYILFVYTSIFNSTESIILNINSLKHGTLFFELIGLVFVVFLAKEKYKSLVFLLFLTTFVVLNPAYLYNSVLYGQVDGIYSAFLFVSTYYSLKNKPSLGILFFMLALNFKLQAITYLPFIFLLNLNSIINKFSFKKLLNVLLPAVIIQLLILLPFALQNDLNTLYDVVISSKGKYPYLSMGAYNFWVILFQDAKNTMDKLGVWGRSYNAIGLMLYVGSMFLALLPLLYWNFKVLILKVNLKTYPVEKVLLVGVLMSLLFFFFNTQMHSRYAHSAMIFVSAYALYSKRVFIFGLLSLAYFLNLEGASKILKGDIVEYSWLVFQPRFVAYLFLGVIILCFYRLYAGVKEDLSLKNIPGIDSDIENELSKKNSIYAD